MANVRITIKEYIILREIKQLGGVKVKQKAVGNGGDDSFKKVINKLRDKDLIFKTPNLFDMREKFISITDLGFEVLKGLEIKD